MREPWCRIPLGDTDALDAAVRSSQRHPTALLEKDVENPIGFRGLESFLYISGGFSRSFWWCFTGGYRIIIRQRHPNCGVDLDPQPYPISIPETSPQGLENILIKLKSQSYVDVCFPHLPGEGL